MRFMANKGYGTLPTGSGIRPGIRHDDEAGAREKLFG